MKIAIATDHNGELIKKEIIKYLESKNYNIVDLSPSNTPVDDYSDYAFLVGNAVSKDDVDLGVLLCGTGIGMSIAANKVKGIRCARVSNINEASLCKEHNNANIIALSTKININDLIKILDIFINTKFSNEERHLRRINKITKFEEGEYNV
ncbi:MAG: RpiB/LacA/LacB family sugar-phosphate isomerase [Bacilli bacterium]|nr:RpiB/LacA/LacB family sugar-phosphate isomerase [Bacilli bacterium]